MLIFRGGGFSLPVPPPPPPGGFPPVSPFGSANLLVWLDSNYPQYNGIDTFSYNSFSALEDLSGNSNGFWQWTKTWQPTVDANGGPFFASANFMDCNSALIFNYLQTITLGFKFRLSSTYTGAALRTLFIVPNASASGQRFMLTFSGGTTSASRKIQMYVRQQDGSVHATATASVAQISNDVDHTLIAQLDLSQIQNSGVATGNLFVDGSPYLVGGVAETWTPTDAQPWQFNPNSIPSEIRMGDIYSVFGLPPTAEAPLVGSVPKFVMLAEYSDPTRLGTLNTYLAA